MFNVERLMPALAIRNKISKKKQDEKIHE